jgi:hypothetical protein
MRAVVEILFAVVKLLQAEGDETRETAALMQAEEAIKRELDRRKFGGGP